jgi:hypothetical protein
MRQSHGFSEQPTQQPAARSRTERTDGMVAGGIGSPTAGKLTIVFLTFVLVVVAGFMVGDHSANSTT